MSQEPDARSFTVEFCYRHPRVQTGVHCTRCSRPICPDCMIEASVGYHCPECVGQARREFRQGPARRVSTVAGLSATRILLTTIIAMFLVEVMVGGPEMLMSPRTGPLVDLGAMVPPFIAMGQYWRLFTSMFLHVGILHLLMNSYVLWFLGQAVEGAVGRTRFLLLYLLCGLIAGATSYAFGDPLVPAMGASGAISGVFGVFIAMNLRRRRTAMGAANLQWAVTMIVLNVVIAMSASAIDWRAHLGGLVAGVAAGYLFEGIGPRARQAVTRAAGFAALAAIGLALVLWRTAELHRQFPTWFS